ncbi:MAG: glycosyltransferase [Alphaproteobacteria bacterium]|nr:glycosyltransferase [Alphaproteobacteria bacterium]
MVKVSIVMPTYNAEAYLKEAIDSILNQTFTDFEFLIIDDSSQDKTRKIIKSYNDKRIRLIDGPCRGISAALNIGLQEAKGDYIARMDADDISLPERLNKQINFMETHSDVGICGTDIERIDQQGKLYEGKRYNLKAIEDVCFLDLLDNRAFFHPTIVIRKKIIKKYHLFYNEELRFAEDFDLWHRAIFVTGIHNMQEKLLKYRVYDNNTSLLYKNEGDKVINKLRSDLLKQITGNKEIYTQAINRAIFPSKYKGKIEYQQNVSSQVINNSKIWLFKFIPLVENRIKIEDMNKVAYIKLCFIFPILKIVNKRYGAKFFLFNFMPIFSIKRKFYF